MRVVSKATLIFKEPPHDLTRLEMPFAGRSCRALRRTFECAVPWREGEIVGLPGCESTNAHRISTCRERFS